MSSTAAGVRDLDRRDHAVNTRLVGHHDLNGHGDGMQLVKAGQYLYVAHLGTSAMALSILDCQDPAQPRLVRQIEHPPNTHRHKVQVVGNLLIQNSEVPYFARGSASTATPITGLCVFNLDDPTDPHQVGFLPEPAKGVHRIWFSELPYAHIATWLPDGDRRGYQIVDLSQPSDPRAVGSWWVPGTMPGETNIWEGGSHGEVHGVIPHGQRGYASCVDAGFALLDLSDVSQPKVLGHVNWSPPYGGYLHTALPLPDRNLVVGVCEAVFPNEQEDGDKRVWLIDVSDETQPATIGSFPKPTPPAGSPWGDSFWQRPLRFGPHNIHENRPHSFNSQRTIFATWYNAGLRIFDISDARRPEEIGCFIPATPDGQAAPQTNDVYVDADGLIYISDRIGGGIDVVEWTGGSLP